MTTPPPDSWRQLHALLRARHLAGPVVPAPDPADVAAEAALLALERGLEQVVKNGKTPTPGNRAETTAMPRDTQQHLATLRAAVAASGQSEEVFAVELGVPVDLLREWLTGYRLVPPTVATQAREVSARLRGEGRV